MKDRMYILCVLIMLQYTDSEKRAKLKLVIYIQLNFPN